MALLKTAVIVMGVLILAGIAVVGVTLVSRVGGGLSAPTVGGRIELPSGAHIVETHVDGKNVVLRLTMANGSSRIAIYGLDGRLVSMIEVVEGK